MSAAASPPAGRRGLSAEAATLSWSCGLLILGALALAAAWDTWLPAACLAAAAVVPLLVLRGVVRLGVSPWATSTVLVTLCVLAGYLLAADAGTSLPDTVRDAVPRLLSAPQPLSVRAELLVGPLLLTALVSLLVGLRSGSAHRVAPVVGAITLYVSGALLTAGRNDRWGLFAGAIVVSALLGWVLLDEHRQGARARLALAVPVAVAATGALVGAAVVPVSAPYEPRTLVDPPVVEVVASSPLPHLGAWASRPDEPLFEVAGPTVPLRLVTLDSYDGTHWSTATRYAPLGTLTEEVALPPGRRTRTSTVEVTLTGLGGRWLPSPGRATDTSLDEAVVDARSGTLYLADSDALGQPGTTDAGAAGLRYQVTGVADAPGPEQLASASVPTTPDVARYLELPTLPPEVQAFAERAVAGAVTPHDRALALEARLHERATLSAKAISGSQLWRITSFLLGAPGEPGARVGTAEQFATAYALLARHNGLPTRVVVGFRAGEADDDGVRVVRGRDATAWPEVYFEELGWVPFSPTKGSPHAPAAEPTPPVTDSGLDDTTDLDPLAEETEPARPGTDGPPSLGRSLAAQGPAWLLLGGLVVVAVLIMLALARLVRTRRHLRRGPAGAWAEVRDALTLARLAPPGHLSADEVAALADRSFGTECVHTLAEQAQRAAFGPPGTAADDPRPLVRVVRRAARRTLPVWRRWWWAFDLRVFAR